MKRLSWLVAALCGGLLAAACAREPDAGNFLPDLDRIDEDYDQIDSLGAYDRLGYRLFVANRDLQASELYVQAAYLYHEAGKLDSVPFLLNRAIDAGMANPKILEKFQGLRPDPGEADWNRLLQRLDSIGERLGEVDHFELRMEAMQAFWPYLERALADTSKAREALQEFIFKGPRELRDYYVVRYYSLDNMYGQMINGSPAYYSYLKRHFNPDSLESLKALTRSWMGRFKEIYPQAVFPNVYVVPGILNSGGTLTEMGLFVGGDLYGAGPDAPVEELTDWQRGALQPFSDMPGIALHELMHFQQNYRDSLNRETVMQKVVDEGVCDFLVELVSGRPNRDSRLAYLQDSVNRKGILADLRRELLSEDLTLWMYNGNSITDRPPDLGYTIGYLVCKSYYERQSDKRAAVYRLLNTDDIREIWAGSDYAFLLPDTGTGKEFESLP